MNIYQLKTFMRSASDLEAVDLLLNEDPFNTKQHVKTIRAIRKQLNQESSQ